MPTSCSTACAWAIIESRSWPLGMRSIISCLIFISRSALERSSERTLKKQRERKCFGLRRTGSFPHFLWPDNAVLLLHFIPYPGSWPGGCWDSAWPPSHWCCCRAVRSAGGSLVRWDLGWWRLNGSAGWMQQKRRMPWTVRGQCSSENDWKTRGGSWRSFSQRC